MWNGFCLGLGFSIACLVWHLGWALVSYICRAVARWIDPVGQSLRELADAVGKKQ